MCLNVNLIQKLEAAHKSDSGIKRDELQGELQIDANVGITVTKDPAD